MAPSVSVRFARASSLGPSRVSGSAPLLVAPHVQHIDLDVKLVEEALHVDELRRVPVLSSEPAGLNQRRVQPRRAMAAVEFT